MGSRREREKRIQTGIACLVHAWAWTRTGDAGNCNAGFLGAGDDKPKSPRVNLSWKSWLAFTLNSIQRWNEVRIGQLKHSRRRPRSMTRPVRPRLVSEIDRDVNPSHTLVHTQSHHITHHPTLLISTPFQRTGVIIQSFNPCFVKRVKNYIVRTCWKWTL